ncbi:MAG: hypothetical protein AB2L20_31115 [Mangrovibacterium sp.]
MMFSILARNREIIQKKIAFHLKKDEKWKLAPAYDVCHAFRPESE